MHNGKVVLHSLSEIEHSSGWIISGPVLSVENRDAGRIGADVRVVLAASKRGVPRNEPTKELIRRLLAELHVRSWLQVVGSASCAGIEQRGNLVSITTFKPVGRMYEPSGGPAAVVKIDDLDAEIGNALLVALTGC